MRIFARLSPHTWYDCLTAAEIAYNNATHSATGFSPFYLVYNHHLNLPIDLLSSPIDGHNDATATLLNDHRDNLQRARNALHEAAQRMQHHSKQRTPAPFRSGDYVLVHTNAFRNHSRAADLTKFSDRWYGPFPITKVINPNAYRIELPPAFHHHNVINVSFLHPYRHSSRFPRNHPDETRPPPVHDTPNNDEHQSFKVESILRHCVLRRISTSRTLSVSDQLRLSNDPHDYEFLIKWKGYPEYESTWEPFEHLANAPAILRDYLLAHQLPLD